MGGIVSAKFLVLLAIALIVLGPDKLPGAARTAGRLLNEFRRVTGDLQTEVRSAFEGSDLAGPVGELRSAAQAWRGGPSAWTSAVVAGTVGGSTSPPPTAGSAVAPTAMPAIRPEGELGIPPGDPSLN